MRYVRATAEDQARLQDFLTQFVDDYLSEHIASYLSSKTGGVFMALDDDNHQLLACGVFDMVKSHEAYLGGTRIRPDMQGSPLAQEFAEFQVQEANKAGATIIRALVGKGHEVSQQVFEENLGFHVVEEWVVGSIEGFDPPAYADADAGPAWAIDHDRLLEFYRQHTEELWADRDHWIPKSLSLDDVWHGLEQGMAAVAPQDSASAIDTFALFQIREGDLHLNYLRSMGHHLKAMMQYLWVESRAWGVKKLQFGLPRNAADKLIEAVGLPVSQEWHGMILEKHVGLTSATFV